ncbi:MAG: septum formation initiator family protein [Sphingomonas bacterium]|nr:septum formation initiator family protein [Sphingomonas bacterium]MDB5685248.1 septum formation initiator family protein [Sphingomonas bacterium]MDB5719163.1 septum formation initiator family protein [Sphingomonas bacterium]
MQRFRSTSSLIRSAAAPALALLVIANFAGYALFGANGMFAWGDYKRSLVTRSAELQVIQSHRDRLARRVRLLGPKVDPDYADELIRRETGQVRPDEYIIPTR